MADQDALKAAEQRGYSRGYTAGQRRKKRAVAVDRHKAVTLAFRQRAFLAALPAVLVPNNWGHKVNGVHQQYTTKEQLVQLAWKIAEEAVDQGVSRGCL